MLCRAVAQDMIASLGHVFLCYLFWDVYSFFFTHVLQPLWYSDWIQPSTSALLEAIFQCCTSLP